MSCARIHRSRGREDLPGLSFFFLSICTDQFVSLTGLTGSSVKKYGVSFLFADRCSPHTVMRAGWKRSYSAEGTADILVYTYILQRGVPQQLTTVLRCRPPAEDHRVSKDATKSTSTKSSSSTRTLRGMQKNHDFESDSVSPFTLRCALGFVRLVPRVVFGAFVFYLYSPGRGCWPVLSLEPKSFIHIPRWTLTCAVDPLSYYVLSVFPLLLLFCSSCFAFIYRGNS